MECFVFRPLSGKQNKLKTLCVLCASVVNISFRQVLVQHRDNRLREGRQTLLGLGHILVRNTGVISRTSAPSARWRVSVSQKL